MESRFQKRLRNTLSQTIEQPQMIRIIVKDTGLNTATIDFLAPPVIVWQSVIEEAKAQEMLPNLFQELRSQFPQNTDLSQLYEEFLSDQSPDSQKRPTEWQTDGVTEEQLERIMGPVPTFLPSAFLYAGWVASRSVVRILTPDSIGSGFLIDRDLLITNNHVLPSEEVANNSHADFDYEIEIDGTYSAHTRCPLDVSIYHTSKEFDLSVVQVTMPADLERQPLRLADEPVRVDERVSIIQHPEGGRKQVALHRNFVTYVDQKILQYFTDTMPGSSGSPIMDSRWRVVGIHHAGGSLYEPKSRRMVFRNQGTALESVRECFSEWNIALEGAI